MLFLSIRVNVCVKFVSVNEYTAYTCVFKFQNILTKIFWVVFFALYTFNNDSPFWKQNYFILQKRVLLGTTNKQRWKLSKLYIKVNSAYTKSLNLNLARNYLLYKFIRIVKK